MKLNLLVISTLLFSGTMALATAPANLTKTVNCRSLKGAEKTVYYHAYYNPKNDSWPVLVQLTINGVTGEASDRVESNDGSSSIDIGPDFKKIESEGSLTADNGNNLQAKISSIDGSISVKLNSTPSNGSAIFKANLDGTIDKGESKEYKAQQEVVCSLSWKPL